MSNVEPTVSTGVRLAAVDATLGYDQTIVLDHLTAEIPDGAFVAIIGPNGCGKSTLLRTFARVLHPATGQVLLDGSHIAFHCLIRNVDVATVRMGMRVRAVWKPESEWTTSFENIEYFEPTGEPDVPYEKYKDLF